MSEELKQVIISRFKSFIWRCFGYAIAGLLAFVLDTVSLLELSPFITTITGLVIGEITKFLNVNLPQLRAITKAAKVKTK